MKLDKDLLKAMLEENVKVMETTKGMKDEELKKAIIDSSYNLKDAMFQSLTEKAIEIGMWTISITGSLGFLIWLFRYLDCIYCKLPL